jgi:hypothetical protein
MIYDRDIVPGGPAETPYPLACPHPPGDNADMLALDLSHKEFPTMRPLAFCLIALASLSFAQLAIAQAPKPQAPKVEEGKPAPEIDLPATQVQTVLPRKKDAKTLKLSHFFMGANRKNVVLYFYPKAMTRG